MKNQKEDFVSNFDFLLASLRIQQQNTILLRYHCLGEKPFKCKMCESAFAQRTSLNVHISSHHKDWIKGKYSKLCIIWYEAEVYTRMKLRISIISLLYCLKLEFRRIKYVECFSKRLKPSEYYILKKSTKITNE